MKTSKKILAVALSVLMLISVLPFAAFATDELPEATVTKIASADLKNLASFDFIAQEDETLSLDVGYKFLAQHDSNTIGNFDSKYKDWIADYVITTDTTIAAGAVTIAGQYNQNSDKWFSLTSPNAFPAGEEMRLLQTMFGNTYIFTYKDICESVREFNCGAVMNNASAAGAVMTVELRLFNPENAADYVVINSFNYKFGNNVKPTASAIALSANELSVNTDKGAKTFDIGYKFVAAHDAQSVIAFAQDNKYATCPADFVITSDADIPAGAVTIGGYYADSVFNGEWQTLTPNATFAAGTQFRLLQNLPGGPYTFTYEDICTLVGTFYCAAMANDAAAVAGTTMSVKLCLFPEGEEPYVVDSFSYKFPAVNNDVQPTATAIPLEDAELSINSDKGAMVLDNGYKFVAAHDAQSVIAFADGNKYANCPADFVITSDADIPAGAATLAGYYAAPVFNGEWQTLTPNSTFAANTDFRLLENLPGGPYTFTYKDICETVGTFYCGMKANNADAYGTTVTVKLVLFPENEEPIVVTSFEYKFVGEVNEGEVNNGADLEVTGDIELNTYVDAEEYIEAGIVDKNEAVFKVTYNKNSDINRKPVYVTEIIPVKGGDIEQVSEQDVNDIAYAETYKYSKIVAPAQITEDVVIGLYESAEATTPVAEVTSSVYKVLKGYVDNAAAYPAELVAFAQATIDYAKAAQGYFNYRVEDLAAVAYSNTEIASPSVSSLDATFGRPAANLPVDLQARGVSLTVKSNVEVNVTTDADFTIGAVSEGASADFGTVNGKRCLVITDITAANTNKSINVGINGETLTISALNICRSIIVNNNSAAYKSLAMALCFYGKTAAAYYATL